MGEHQKLDQLRIVTRCTTREQFVFAYRRFCTPTSCFIPSSDLKPVGTIAAIRQMAKVPNGGVHVIIEGLTRAKSDVMTNSDASLRAIVSPLPEVADKSLEIDAYVRRLHELIDRALSLATGLSQELRGLVAGIDDPLRLAYLLASLLDMKAEEKQKILEANDLNAKLQAVNFGAQAVLSGASQLVVAGGVEHMTRVPMGSDAMGGEGPASPGLQQHWRQLVPQGLQLTAEHRIV